MDARYTAIYAIVARIPQGKVSTYGALARIVPVPRGARGVGWAMARCPADIPWWRVVSASGKITAPDAQLQEALLVAEGVLFRAPGIVDLHRAGWHHDLG
ncbi:MAG: hypothetical protein RLY87_2715 [Chloroflexota bacterium]|jgi:methylated-DNA-protein-cysteine methyltransferase-like protein